LLPPSDERRALVRREILGNGFTLLVREMHTAPVVALGLWVGSGSIDDPDERGGLAHFIEHMLFKGLDDDGAVDLADVVQGAGGYLNAQTGSDHTLYHQVVPSEHWADVLHAQSVAVSSPVFEPDDIERERAVILEEARSGEDDPTIAVWRRLMRIAFVRHPCRRPIVGSEDDLQAITLSDLRSHFERHYVPGNMVQVVVGDVDARDVVERGKALFGGLVPGERPLRPDPGEPPQDALRARTVAGRIEQSYLAIAFHIPRATHPDLPALDALCGLLGVGRSSRLRKSLQVSLGLVSEVGSFVAAHRDTGLLAIRARPTSAGGADAVVRKAMSEIERLRCEAVGAAEMEKNLARLEAGYVLEHETVESIAAVLGLFETYGDYRYASEYVDRLAAVTPGDVMRVAREYLAPSSASVVSYVPEGSDLPTGDRSAAVAALLEEPAARPISLREADAVWSAPPAFERPMIIAERATVHHRREELENGATLILCESPALPITALALGFRGGFRDEPVARSGITLLTQKLVTRGSEGLPVDELADRIEGLGSAISTAVDRDGFGLGATVLSKHFDEAVDLIGRVVTEPTFPVEQLNRARAEIAAEIGAIDDQPLRRALRLLLPLVFPGHTYGRPLRGNRETVKTIDREAVAAWHRERYTASNLVVCAVGDLARGTVRKGLERALAGLPPGRPIADCRPVDDAPSGRAERELAGGKQSVVAVALRGAREGTRDSVVLGFLARTLTMMGGRLWTALRERPPHAYHTGASHVSLVGGGAFIVYATTPPGQEEAAVESFGSELERLRAEGLAHDELVRGRRYFTGTLEIGLQRRAARAAGYAMGEVLGVGYEHIERLPALVRRITNEEVIEAARLHLDPEAGLASVVLQAG